jgi:hypothetical protein
MFGSQVSRHKDSGFLRFPSMELGCLIHANWDVWFTGMVLACYIVTLLGKFHAGRWDVWFTQVGCLVHDSFISWVVWFTGCQEGGMLGSQVMAK